MKLLILTIDVILSYAILSQPVFGDEVGTKNYPYLVSIQDPLKHVCTGSIISERFVLSAAICFDESFVKRKSLKIIHPSSSSANNQSIHRIANYFVHEKYSYNVDYSLPHNNLALIEVEDPFVFGDRYESIKLVDENEEIQSNKTGSVLGWVFGTLAEHLLNTTTAVVDQERCVKDYNEYYNNFFTNEICVISNDSNFSKLNWGGPLVINGRLAAIESLDITGNNSKGFTNLASYRNWIKKHAKIE